MSMTKPKAPIEGEYNSTELTMKKGRWSLWQEPNGASTLWHQCSKGREEVYGEKEKAYVVYPIKYRTWSYKTKKDVKPRWCCGMCDKKPPESILVPWMMHNWDDLAEMMENDAPKPGSGRSGSSLKRMFEARPPAALL